MALNESTIKILNQILCEIQQLQGIAPFIYPVNWQELNIPDYPEVIKYPMDLSTVSVST